MEPSFFTQQVDEMILELAPFDPELKTGLEWIDQEAKRRGIDFYEMVYIVLCTHDSNQRAKEWVKNKT